MARTLGYLFLAGATLGLASLAFEHGPHPYLPALALPAGVAYLTGAILVVWAGRLPDATIPGFLAGGTLLITSAVYSDGSGSSIYALFYVWVGVQAFYFLSRPKALLQLALVGVSYAWVLENVPHTAVPYQRWLMTVGTAQVVGLLIAYQGERIERLVARLTDAARTDPLTGLLNRRAFGEHFDAEIECSRRSGSPLSVLVGDLDGFKLVNDRLGHQAGDDALTALAKDLETWKRSVDTVARLGGEEFALLLPEADENGSLLVAERLRRAVKRTFAELEVPLTISFGIATFPDHGHDPDLVLGAADQALYAAKHMGRDRSVIYSSEVAQPSRRGQVRHLRSGAGQVRST